LGDQVTWEQILARFNGKKRLWIISRDGDFGTLYGRRGFVNRFLLDELCKVTANAEAYLFTDLVEGIADFVEKTGVKAEKQLTPEEAEEVGREEQSLQNLLNVSSDGRREATQMMQTDDDLRRVAKAMQPYDDLRRAAAQMMRPYDDLRHSAAQMMQRYDDLRRAGADMKNWMEPAEELRKRMAELTKFAQPIDSDDSSDSR